MRIHSTVVNTLIWYDRGRRVFSFFIRYILTCKTCQNESQRNQDINVV